MREIFVIKGDGRVWIQAGNSPEVIYTTDNLDYAKFFQTYDEALAYLPFVVENCMWETYFSIEKYYMK